MPTFSPRTPSGKETAGKLLRKHTEGSLSCLLSLKHVKHGWKRRTKRSKHNRLGRKQTIQTAVWAFSSVQFSSVQSLSRVRLFVTPWSAACQASLSITNSRSSPKLMSIESVYHPTISSSRPLLLLPLIFPSIRVFSNESALHIRGSKYWSFSFSISPSNENPGLILGWTGWISLLSKGLSRVFSNTTVQKHQFFGTQLSL